MVKFGSDNDVKSDIFYIEPGKPYSAKQILIEDIMSKPKKRVWICDPYVGIRLLDILKKIDASIEIRIITHKVEYESLFIRTLGDFKQEHPSTEVRKTTPDIHDRYVLSETHMWLVGHSLKDLGKKETFIVPLGEDIRQPLELAFETRWNSSLTL